MRKPGSLSHTWFVVFGSIALSVAYVLSYAPAQHFRSIQSTADPPGPPDPWMTLYRPVEWMIDETPLKKPLLGWGDVCHTDGIIAHDMDQREVMRRYSRD